MTCLPPDLAVEVLGLNPAATLEQIVEREKATRGWGPQVTANYLMATWSRLVDEIEHETYPEHMMVEEYANDLYSRKLLQTLIEVTPHEIAEALSNWVAPLDARFMAATVRADRPFHGSSDPASPHVASPWHWLIPRRPTGRLAKDLARMGLM